MSVSLKVFEIQKGDEIEFAAGTGPLRIHTVIASWGVRGINGPIEPWMVSTKDSSGRFHSLTLNPYLLVVCHRRTVGRAPPRT